MFQGGIRAHGGQGAVAGEIVSLPQLNAVFRGTTRVIRVWQGLGAAEEFTVDEALILCRRGDLALMSGSMCGANYADLMIDTLFGTPQCLTLPRQWLIAFLAALRRALRTADTAHALAPKRHGVEFFDAPRPGSFIVIDADSEPGSWDRHLRHTAAMRRTPCVDVDADSS